MPSGALLGKVNVLRGGRGAWRDAGHMRPPQTLTVIQVGLIENCLNRP